MKRPEFTRRITGSRPLLVTLLGALAIGGSVACNSSKSSARGNEPKTEPKNQPQKVTGVNARPMKLDPLSDFSLTDQSGKSTNLAALKGKPWVAAFFFTRCPTVCPKLTQRMQLVQGQAYREGGYKKSQDALEGYARFSDDLNRETHEVTEGNAIYNYYERKD